MKYVILSPEYYTMLAIRKLMADVSASAVFAGWAEDIQTARRVITEVLPILVLGEVELADGSLWDVVNGWPGYVIPIYESLADSETLCGHPCPGKLVKPVSAGDLKKVLFHLK